MLLVALGGALAARMGSEFIPSLDEGDIALHALRIPGTGIEQAIGMQLQLDARLAEFPEVERVFAKLGTADIATDPMPPSVADTYVILKEREDWPDPRKPKDELVRELEAAAARVPGNNYEFTQPIEMRFNELISGVRADVAVKVYGDDLDDAARARRARSRRSLRGIPGGADVALEQMTGLPMLTVQPRRARARALRARRRGRAGRGLAPRSAAKPSAQIFEGDQRFDLVIRLPEAVRNDPATLATLPVPLARRRLRAAARARDRRGRRGPERDQSRERQAARRRDGQRARPRSRLVRRRGARAHRRRASSFPPATGSSTAARSSS